MSHAGAGGCRETAAPPDAPPGAPSGAEGPRSHRPQPDQQPTPGRTSAGHAQRRSITLTLDLSIAADAQLDSDHDAVAAGSVAIWTDGSCRPNPGRGGWAAILRMPDGAERVTSGAEPRSTNNRMELTAAIRALEALPARGTAVVHSDSEYVVRGMTEWLPGWQANRWRTAKGKPVENADLWQRLSALARRHEVGWRWVRGHADAEMNLRADRLAVAARDGAECE